MPVPKFNRELVKEVAAKAKVSPDAVWINVLDDKIQVFFWTEKMNARELKSLAGVKNRHVIQKLLDDYSAEGWMTKVHPRDAQPHDLHPLRTSLRNRDTCMHCGNRLITQAEAFIGKCEECVPK